MKLNKKTTVLVGLAFLSICAFWQMYDSLVPLILTNHFRLDETWSGAIMAADNVLALFLLPLFGSFSDRVNTRLGKRMPFILLGTVVSAIAFPFIPVCFHYSNVAGVIALMAIVIFFMMMYRSPAVALMPDITPKPLRSKANGIINIMGYLGGAFATLAGIVFVLSDYLGTGDITWATGNIWAIEAPFLIASVIGFAAAGFIADKIGRKYTMLIGLGLAIAGYFIMCFTLEGHPAGKDEYAAFPWHLYLVYILKGLGMSLVNTCSFPMVVELATGKKVGQFTGYYYAASMGAQTVTPVIVGLVIYLVPDFGWRMLPIYATVMMAVSIAIFMFVKNVKIHNVDTPKGLEAMGDLD